MVRPKDNPKKLDELRRSRAAFNPYSTPPRKSPPNKQAVVQKWKPLDRTWDTNDETLINTHKLLDANDKSDRQQYDAMKNVTPDDRFLKAWSVADKQYLRSAMHSKSAAYEFWLRHQYSVVAMTYYNSIQNDGKRKVSMSNILRLAVPEANMFPPGKSPIKQTPPQKRYSAQELHKRYNPELYALDDDLDLSELDMKLPADPPTCATDNHNKDPKSTQNHDKDAKSTELQSDTTTKPKSKDVPIHTAEDLLVSFNALVEKQGNKAWLEQHGGYCKQHISDMVR